MGFFFLRGDFWGVCIAEGSAMVVGECCGELVDVVAKLSLAGGAKTAS